MPLTDAQILTFLSSVHPYDTLPPDALTDAVARVEQIALDDGAQVYAIEEPLRGIYVIHSGAVDVTDANGQAISHLGPRNSFGERGFLQDGRAATTAHASGELRLLLVPAALFSDLYEAHAAFRRFFDRSGSARRDKSGDDVATRPVESLMTRDPVTCDATDTAQHAAQIMRDRRVSALCVMDSGQFAGIISVRDMTSKLVADAMPFDTPVSDLMTRDPMTLPPDAIVSDVLTMMMERKFAHVPVVKAGELIGIVSQTDLTRVQARSAAELVAGIAKAADAGEIASITAMIPDLLVQLVAGGRRHDVVTRLITDIADAATRRLLALGEERFGPAPVPYLWLACGSQGRQEQTGVSDQDNCLILDDAATPDHDAYFADLASFVCHGLNEAGYVYCPGDMMATAPRWRQPLRVWRDYFRGWINTPDPEAQMLASVMFDLRPISGDVSLFTGLQSGTLEAAAKNTIFVGHMLANSMKHSAPLSLLRGLATIRSGEHKNQIDMKMNGVVPIVDLGRLYALTGKIEAVNTRARLEAARAAGLLSSSGGADLLDAYDMIAGLRLDHQADQIKAGERPDNYLAPSGLSDFERSHLRDAFVVVKTMQSSLSHGKILN